MEPSDMDAGEVTDKTSKDGLQQRETVINTLTLPQVIRRLPVDQLKLGGLATVRISFRDWLGFGPQPMDEIVLPIGVYLNLCQAAIIGNNEPGSDYRDMVIGLMFVGNFLGSRTVDHAFADRISRLYMHMMILAAEQAWKTKTDAMLALSYTMLINRIATRDEVFMLAAHNLQDNPPKSANSWRVRVDAYARTRELPPVGQPLRRRSRP